MTTETIFNAPATTEQVAITTSPVLSPEVAEIVGQGKKYATLEAAVASVPHAQKHIQTLESELALAKEELAKRKTTEELLAEIKQNGFNKEESDSSEFKPEQVTQLVNDTITKQLAQKEAEAVAKVNTSKVTEAFISKFGDKAEEVFKTVASESGLTIGNLNYLAATSPSAVLKLAGIVGKVDSSVSKITSSVNTESITNKPTDGLSARVKPGASTKDLVSAWRNAGAKVGRTYN